MSDRLLLVARVAGAFGIKGDVRITTFTEDPLALGRYRDLRREDGSPGLVLSAVRVTKGGVIARAAGVDNRDQAEILRGLKLFVARESLPAPDEDEFYLADLIGLSVETREGDVLGRIKAINDFGAGDLLEIQPPAGPSWWLPFTRANVPEVLLQESRVIAIRPEETE